MTISKLERGGKERERKAFSPSHLFFLVFLVTHFYPWEIECDPINSFERKVCFMKGSFEYNYHHQGIYYLNENHPEENPSEKPILLPAVLIDICHRNGPDIGIATYLTDEEVLKLKGNGIHYLCTKFMKKLNSVAIFP